MRSPEQISSPARTERKGALDRTTPAGKKCSLSGEDRKKRTHPQRKNWNLDKQIHLREQIEKPAHASPKFGDCKLSDRTSTPGLKRGGSNPAPRRRKWGCESAPTSPCATPRLGGAPAATHTRTPHRYLRVRCASTPADTVVGVVVRVHVLIPTM